MSIRRRTVSPSMLTIERRLVTLPMTPRLRGRATNVACVNPPYAAVVLAGGAARRLGGQAKPELRLGGRRLLELVLAAVPDACPRIVVGPPMELPPGGRLVREEPAGGGPVAGLAAGLAELPPDVGLVAVLAADLPFLTDAVIAGLLDAVAAAAVADGAVLVDGDGRDQLLIGVWQVPALRGAVADLPTTEGASMRATIAGLDVVRVSWDVPAGTPPPWWDCDSAADLHQAKEWLSVSELQEWTDRVVAELGLPEGLDQDEIDLILDLARDSAHGVARPAAPLTTYLLGLAVGRGADRDEAVAQITALALDEG